MAEKLWRMDTTKTIETYVRTQNRELKEELNVHHSKSDIKLFQLRRKNYIEEDVFTYFYPFCLFNCMVLTGVTFRKNSLPVIATAVMSMAEYVYFLFSFPVENWHFHKRAVAKDKPYAQYLRDTYIERFPQTCKARVYTRINRELEKRYTTDMRVLKSPF